MGYVDLNPIKAPESESIYTYITIVSVEVDISIY